MGGNYWHKRRGKANGRERKHTQRIHSEAEATRRKDRDTLLERAGATEGPLARAIKGPLIYPYGMAQGGRRIAEIMAQKPPTQDELSAVLDRYFAGYQTIVDWIADMPKPRPYYMHPSTFACEYMAAGRAYTELSPNVYRIDDALNAYVIETHKSVREGYATTERPADVGSVQDDTGRAPASREQDSGGG